MTTTNEALTVEQVMSEKVITIHPDAPIRDALRVMMSERYSTLPVVNDEEVCVGVIAARDLVEMAYEMDQEITRRETVDDVLMCLVSWDEIAAALGSEKVSKLMTLAFHSLPPLATLKEAARVMVDASIHHLPIIRADDGRIVGIVSTTDIVRTFASALEG